MQAKWTKARKREASLSRRFYPSAVAYLIMAGTFFCLLLLYKDLPTAKASAAGRSINHSMRIVRKPDISFVMAASTVMSQPLIEPILCKG